MSGAFPLENFAVILARPRFPENIGMVARACANMGCPHLILTSPERWDILKAAPLATGQGEEILKNIRVYSTLEEALAPFHFSIATSARLGGWRRKLAPPQKCGEVAIQLARSGQKIALVFGPEDRGLSNRDVCQCDLICHIPTANKGRSLNLAQAALILLYECHKLSANNLYVSKSIAAITHAERMRLEETFKNTLADLDCLHGQNPDYFFQQWQAILRRSNLERHEYDALMGFCRQIARLIKTR